MANRLKEDEKNERIIRNLLKLPENRRCINCNSLGPQYVCTNFSTFVCTTCSGIHREFTHRVKSVSMAKFTPQEVSALQGGGNASAREIYLKEWDPQRNSLPDGSNIDRLRDFIKHVYVDRRYTGEKNSEKPLKAKMGETEDFGGNRRIDTYQGGSRSPPYGDRPSPGGRSPAYDQTSDYKRSPARVEVVNDWRREDRFGNGRRSEDRSEVRSPDSQRDSDISSPPMIRPVRDILGENVSPLRVIEPPKVTGVKSIDGSAHTQRTASSSSLASSDANPSEIKVEASFIDFDSVPEPEVTVPQTQQVAGGASSNNDWANFDSVPEVKAPTAVAAALNPMESLLSELSISAAPTSGQAPVGKLSPFQSSGSQGSSFGSSFGSTVPPSVLPYGGAPAASAPQLANVKGSFLTNAHTGGGGQWPTMAPQQHSMFPGGISQPVSQLVTPVISGSSSYKPWNPLGPNAHGPPGASNFQVGGQAATNPAKGTTFGFSSEDANSGGRKALPEDLFALNYSYTPSPASGWYSGSPYVSGVPMQYNNTPMASWAVQNLQPVSRSTNPFDVGTEPSPVQASTFPSVASLQGALPKSAAPSYASAIPPSSYVVGQETAGGIAPRAQGLSGFGIEESGFALGGLHPAQSAPSNFTSASGNPFG